MTIRLHIEAKEGTLASFKVILAAYPTDLTYVDEDYGSPAHFAVENFNETERLDILKFLSEYYPACMATVDCRDQYPLHSMMYPYALRCNIGVLQAIYFAYPPAIKAKDTRGYLPLYSLLFDLHYMRWIYYGDDERFTDPDAIIASLQFLLKMYPEALENPPPKSLRLNILSESVRRVILRAKPQLDMAEYRRLNWKNRYVTMWLARGKLITTKNAEEGTDSCVKDLDALCLRKLGKRDLIDMLREVVSFI